MFENNLLPVITNGYGVCTGNNDWRSKHFCSIAVHIHAFCKFHMTDSQNVWADYEW